VRVEQKFNDEDLSDDDDDDDNEEDEESIEIQI
jgi:hypothetical protein